MTFSHEPGVGFAADGYARSTRRLGVVCVTYGAGGYNCVNPVAGAYAEQVPLLVVSGGPGEAERQLSRHPPSGEGHRGPVSGLLRGDLRGARSCAIRRRAAQEVHEIVRRILTELRPGYLEIHRDMVDVEIPVPPEIAAWEGSFPRAGLRPPQAARGRGGDGGAPATARSDPVLIGGLELYRERAERAFRRLAERCACRW